MQSNFENFDQDTVAELPIFNPMEPSNVQWDEIDTETISFHIDKAYHRIAHWRHNLFKVPSRNAGRLFVTTLTSLLSAHADGTPIESIALKAAMTMPAFYCRDPIVTQEMLTTISLLKDRLARWKCGYIEFLLHEGSTFNLALKKGMVERDTTSARTFARLMEVGNVKVAVRMVSDVPTQGSLSLKSIQPDGQTVKEHLLEKHPAMAEPICAAIQTTSPELILQNEFAPPTSIQGA